MKISSRRIRAGFTLAAALIMGAGAVHAAPASVTVGNPKDPGALAPAIQVAYQNGARHIVIRPGTYLLPNVGHTAISLDNWQDATLSAYHVTLILTDLAWMHDAFDLNNCKNVTLLGPTVSQTGLNAYQGRVVSVGTDAAGNAYCDWKPDVGYPVPPADAKQFPGGDANVIDTHTRVLKPGNPDFYGLAMDPPVNGTYRMRFNQPKVNFGVGDWLVGRYGDAPFKVFLNGSHDCTVKDVTMTRNGFANVREDGGGGNHLLHCVWALGPRPAGATEDPLVTNTADGLHSTNADPGLDIENCDFRGVFLDDCIAIHGGFQTVKSAVGNTLTLSGDAGALKIGQPARISSDNGFFAEATVTGIQDNGDKTTTVTLDRALDVHGKALVSNPRRDGEGYKIIGCRLGNTRSRGMLLKGDNGLVENNVVEGCGMSAISIGPEAWWHEADYVQRVTIIGNTLRENGKMGYDSALWVHGDGAQGNRDITIKDNRFIGNDGGDIKVEWASGVTLSGNVMTGPRRWPPGVKPHPPIALANSRDVTLRGNVVKSPESYATPLVAAGANVTGLVNDDSAGLQTADASRRDADRR